MGKYKLAVADYTKAIEIDPAAQVYFNRACAHQELGRHDLALADGNTVIELTPDDPDAYELRAISFQALGQKGRAAVDLSRAKKLSAAAR
jgi:tetratricopeptide (TPR) repeat protein